MSLRRRRKNAWDRTPVVELYGSWTKRLLGALVAKSAMLSLADFGSDGPLNTRLWTGELA